MLNNFDNAASRLDIDLEYGRMVELAHQHRNADAPATAAVIELLAAFDQAWTSPEHGGENALFWELRDLRPSVMVTLLALVDQTHCHLAEVLQAYAEDTPYADVTAPALKAHLDASDRTTWAIEELRAATTRR